MLEHDAFRANARGCCGPAYALIQDAVDFVVVVVELSPCVVSKYRSIESGITD